MGAKFAIKYKVITFLGKGNYLKLQFMAMKVVLGLNV